MFDVQLLKGYPEAPGVYLMKDSRGKILYIGKAKNLKFRLKQYFPGGDGRVQISFLLQKVVDIQTIITSSEKDALLLEARLIKQHKPQYNILLKDDRSPLLIRISTHHQFPGIELLREKDVPLHNKGRLFGPFARQLITRHFFDLVVRICLLRQCSDEEFRRRTSPCLLHQIRRCTAPCVGKILAEAYKESVQQALSILSGKTAFVESFLRSKMEEASEQLEFEKAASWLRKLEILETIHSEKIVEKTPGTSDTDVVGYWQEGKRFALAILHYREATLVFGESWDFTLEDELASAGCEEQLVAQYYLENGSHENGPKEILLPVGEWSTSTLQEVLHERLSATVELKRPKTNKEHSLISLACDNARAKLFQTPVQNRNISLLLSIQEQLELKRLPRIIDCFDASHFGGKGRVAACVGFVDGDKEPSRYRKFIMKNVVTGNDLAMLQEAVHRRYRKDKETEELPDLILIDGGKEQLTAVLRTLLEIGFLDVDVVAITKEHGRHDRGITKERFFVADHESAHVFSDRSSELHFLQRIRDEAHRFAIQFQKKRRSTELFSSRLSSIPGIGEVKQRKLLMAFKGIRDMTQASIEEISSKGGVSLRDATAVYQALHVCE